jgi:hypothetical protein
MINKDVLYLIRLLGWTIQVTYIYCEANTCADALALRKHLDFYLHVLDAVPASTVLVYFWILTQGGMFLYSYALVLFCN